MIGINREFEELEKCEIEKPQKTPKIQIYSAVVSVLAIIFSVISIILKLLR